MAVINTAVVLPNFNVPFMDTNGQNDPQWITYLLGISTFIGGSTSATLPVIDAKATLALSQSTTAISTANSAQASASQALTLATTANSTANSARSIAIQTANSLGNFLNKNNNLSDVSSASVSRTNLGVNTREFEFNFPILPPSTTIYKVIKRQYFIPANFVGSGLWAETVPTINAVFTVGYIRGGPGSPVSNTIGTIGLVHSGNFPLPFVGSAVFLQDGDILWVSSPSVQDATLNNVSVTIGTNIV